MKALKFILIIMILAAAGRQALFSQIRYTDVDPDDTTDTWNKYSFHFLRNHDSLHYGDSGTFDIWKHPTEVVLNSLDQDCQALCDAVGLPLAMDKGQTISSVSTFWVHPSYISLNSNGTTGHWIGVNDKYLGLRFKFNGQRYYGWARLEVASDASFFIIKDYASETLAGQGLNAGDTMTSGIYQNESFIDGYIISGNDLFVQFKNNTKGGNIVLYNLFGQEISRSMIAPKQETVKLNNLPDGILLLVFSNGKNSETLKININH